MIPNTVVGSYTGTGAAVNIVLGFKPDHVRVVNVTDGDIVTEAFRGLGAAGASIDIAAAVAPNAADGITSMSYEGATGEGFSVGTDLSELGKVYGYVAIRSGPGAS